MGTDDPGIDAAAKVIYEAARFHHWWVFAEPYDKLDLMEKMSSRASPGINSNPVVFVNNIKSSFKIGPCDNVDGWRR
jgi:hypothetical protein